MARFIPKDQLRAYTRWEADAFDAPAPPKPAPPPPPRKDEPPSSTVVETIQSIPLPTAEDIERIHDEAHAAGFQAGYDEGYQAGMAAAQPQIERMATLAQNLQGALLSLDQDIAESLLALGIDLAEQITRATIEVRPESLLPIIREALAALPLHHEAVTLQINPADAEWVQTHLGDQFSHAGWHILEMGEISPGGCLVRAGASEVDATLRTRWRRTLETIGLSQEWLDAR